MSVVRKILSGKITAEDLIKPNANGLIKATAELNTINFPSNGKPCFQTIWKEPQDNLKDAMDVAGREGVEELEEVMGCTKFTHPGEAIHEFLMFVYDEIEALINQSTTQPNSRINTPVAHSRSNPPVTCVNRCSTPIQNAGEHKVMSTANVTDYVDNHTGGDSQKQNKAPRRMQLFNSGAVSSKQTVLAPQSNVGNEQDLAEPNSRFKGDRTAQGGKNWHRRTQLFSPGPMVDDCSTPNGFTPPSTTKNQQPATINTSNQTEGAHHTEGKHERKREPRRAQLFSTDTPDGHSKRQHSANHFRQRISPNQNNMSPCRPLGSSSPTSYQANPSNSRNGFTLADFVTPDRKKNKKAPRKPSAPILSALSISGDKSLMENDAQGAINSSLSLSDTSAELTTSTEAPMEIKPSRRITPTEVSDNCQWSNFKQQAVFTPESPRKSKVKPGSFSEERRKLREKKAQLLAPISEPALSSDTTTPRKARRGVTDSQLTSARFVCPQLDLITRREEVVTAAKVYAALIEAGKTRDATADLHLLVQIICCQVTETSGSSDGGESLLGSIHNGLLFAVLALSGSKSLERLLDSSLCKLLSENDRVLSFSPSFAHRLSDLSLRLRNPNLSRSTFSSVSFQTETDNTKNFPSDRHFIAFKKQRDLFYEIKRLWDENRLNAGWSFRSDCSSKIYHLLNCPGAGLSNYLHLCRLFVNQLIVSSLSGSDIMWSETDDESISLLSQLKLTQPDKYKKLRERFTMPTMTSVPASKQASFSDTEVFFKNFIDVAKDAVFVQHLKDALMLKLVTLNELEFSPNDDTDTSDSLERFGECVMMSRLVAKFLSYLHFFSYHCDEKITPALDEQYAVLRTTAGCVGLDVGKFLDEGRISGRLCLVIPWLTQYLCQVDAYSLTLSPYRDITLLLYNHLEKMRTSFNTLAQSYSLLIQYVCLQWLFSLDKFDELELSYDDTLTLNDVDSYKTHLDRSNIVTVDVVHRCSSILQACRCLLVEYVMGAQSKLTFTRKITPVSTVPSAVVSTPVSLGASLQQQLEDNFFQNQPASLKKSVDFVAERVSSSYIKDFRSGLLTKVMIEQRIKARKLGFEIAKGNNQAMQLIRVKLAYTIEQWTVDVVDDLHAKALNGIREYLKHRVDEILTLLLPSDTERHIISLVSSVALRQGKERVEKWLSSYLTTQYISSELIQEAVKYVRSSFTTQPPDTPAVDSYVDLGCTSHNAEAPSPFDVMIELHSIYNRLSTSDPLSATVYSDMLSALEIAHSCLTERCDILPSALRTILYLTVSVLLLYKKTSNEPFPTESIEKCQFLWVNEKISLHTADLVDLIPDSELCSRSECNTFHYKFMGLLISSSSQN